MHTFDVAIIVLSFRLIDSRLFGVSCHFSCWCLLCQLLGCRFMFFLVHAFCGCRVAFLVHVHVSSSCACILVTPWFHDDMIFWGFRHCWKWNTVALTFFRWASTIGSRSMENNLHSWSLDLRKTNFWQPSFFTNRNLLRISYLFGESIWVVFWKSLLFHDTLEQFKVAACPLLQIVHLNADDCGFQISPIDEGILALGQQLVLDVNQEFFARPLGCGRLDWDWKDACCFQTCFPLLI